MKKMSVIDLLTENQKSEFFKNLQTLDLNSDEVIFNIAQEVEGWLFIKKENNYLSKQDMYIGYKQDLLGKLCYSHGDGHLSYSEEEKQSYENSKIDFITILDAIEEEIVKLKNNRK